MTLKSKLAIAGILAGIAVGVGLYFNFMWQNCWSMPTAEIPGWCWLLK